MHQLQRHTPSRAWTWQRLLTQTRRRRLSQSMAVKYYHLRQDVVSPQKIRKQKKENGGITDSAVYGSKFRCTWNNKGVIFNEIQFTIIHSMSSSENGLFYFCPVTGRLSGTEETSLVFLIVPLTCHLTQITSFPYVCLISKALPAGIFSPTCLYCPYKILQWSLDSSLQKWCITAIRTGSKTYSGALSKNPHVQIRALSFSCLEDSWLLWLLLVVSKSMIHKASV